MPNVVIIEQRPILRLGIKNFLEKEFNFNLSDFATLQESRSASLGLKPDLIFLGVDGDFKKATDMYEVKKIYRESRLIVYDPEAKEETGIKYLRSGAQGYLSKKSDLMMLGICVRTVLDGKIYVEPAYMDTLLEGLLNVNKTSRKKVNNHGFSLSSRQYEIALLLTQGMSTSEIALKLGLQASTVSTIKSVVYSKLKVDSVIRLKEVMVDVQF